MSRYTIKEIFELGDLHSKYLRDSERTPCEVIDGKIFVCKPDVMSYDNYMEAAPSMEAWLREIVELLPKLESAITLHVYDPYGEDVMSLLQNLMKRAGLGDE